VLNKYVLENKRTLQLSVFENIQKTLIFVRRVNGSASENSEKKNVRVKIKLSINRSIDQLINQSINHWHFALWRRPRNT